VPTSLAELEQALRKELGLTQREALLFLNRLTPTFELLSLAEAPTEATTSPAATGTGNVAGVAAEFAGCQLLNPAASGVIFLLDLIVVSHGPTTGDFRLRRGDTALATLQTTKSWTDLRRRGLPVGEMRVDTDAVAPGTDVGGINLIGGSNEVIPFPKPFVLAAGQGLIGLSVPLANSAKTWWLWREEATL